MNTTLNNEIRDIAKAIDYVIATAHNPFKQDVAIRRKTLRSKTFVINGICKIIANGQATDAGLSAKLTTALHHIALLDTDQSPDHNVQRIHTLLSLASDLRAFARYYVEID